MSSAVRSENAFTAVKSKSAVSKVIRELLKEPLEQISHAQEKLADELEEIAEKENGVFDNEEMTVSFGTNEEEVIVYASLDENDKPVYQAIHRKSKPTVFVAGLPQCKFNNALTSLRNTVANAAESD